jgi:dolichol-phosphate mannosyltransferase
MAQGRTIDISAVLPCYEEVEILAQVVDELAAVLGRVSVRWEILLVTAAAAADGTPDLARRLAAEATHVRCVVQPAHDPGYGCAVALGVAAARYEWLLLIDADGQLDPRDLFRLVRLADRVPDAGLVVGYRAPRRDSWPRRAAGAVYSRVVSTLLGIEGVRDVDCAFKLVGRKWVGTAPLRSRTGAVNAELLCRALDRGARVVELPVSHQPRRTGQARFEMRLGILSHLPHPVEVWAIVRDVAALWSRRTRARTTPQTR